jgi:hypothetical protein
LVYYGKPKDKGTQVLGEVGHHFLKKEDPSKMENIMYPHWGPKVPSLNAEEIPEMGTNLEKAIKATYKKLEE